MADCCFDVERLIDEVIEIIREKFNGEQAAECSYKTVELDPINSYDVHFGRPQVMHARVGIAVWCSDEIAGTGEEGFRHLIRPAHSGGVYHGYQGACATLEGSATLVLGVYVSEYDDKQAARRVSRALTILKRLLLRNPYVISSGVAYTLGIQALRVSHHSDIPQAFNNPRTGRVNYAHGSLTVTYKVQESYEGDVSP